MKVTEIEPLEITDGESVGNSLEARFWNDRFNFTIDNPWAGSTETGFGYSCHMGMTKAQAQVLHAWLSEILE